MRNYWAAAFFLMILCACLSAAHAATQEIVAVVNEDAITQSDLSKRMGLIMASSGLPNAPEIRARLQPQVLNGLIEEQLMTQQAKKLGLEVTAQEVEDGFAAIAQQNKMSAEQFKAMIRRGGLDISTLESQIRAQIGWGKVVQAKLRPKVTISARDVDDALARIKAKVGTAEYLAAEIFLPADGPGQDEQAMQLANRLVSEMKRGKASFFKLAQQFSKSAGSAKGGDMGWLQESQIAPEFLSALKGMKKSDVSAPIRTAQGVHILFLRDSRTLTEATVPSRDQITQNLGIERLDRLQRRHLQDIRAASFVDVRV